MTEWNRPADHLRQTAENAYKRIRSRSELTPAAQRALIAKQYLTQKSKMDELTQKSASERAAAVAQARRQTLGVEDLRSHNGGPASFGALDMAWRSAQDKAASLPSSRHVDHEMQAASDTGDELYVRALGNRLISEYLDMTARGFRYQNDTLNAYLAARPAQAQALNDLQTLSSVSNNISDTFEFGLPIPAEIRGSMYNVGALAAQADAMQAAI